MMNLFALLVVFACLFVADEALLLSPGNLNITELLKARAQMRGIPDKWHEEGPWGGSGGAEFDDWNQFGASDPKCMRVLKGKVANYIGTDYRVGPDETIGHGGDGDEQDKFPLKEGEYITGADIRSGDRVDGFRLRTNMGRESTWYGETGGALHTYEAPKGEGVLSLFGRAGSELDALGFYVGPIPEFCDQVNDVSGYWHPFVYNGGAQTLKYTYSTTHSYTESTSHEWGTSVTNKVSAGFSFKKIFSASVDVSSTFSAQTALQYSSAFGTTETFEETVDFPAGQIWQWTFNISDACGGSQTRGKDWVHTLSAADYPCCPVGLAKEPTNQMGTCVDESLSVCSP